MKAVSPLASAVPVDTTIIEILPSGPELARALAGAGLTRYLALAEPVRLDLLRVAAPDLRDRFVPMTSHEAVIYNNASLLICGSEGLKYLSLYRAFRHARYIAYPAELRGAFRAPFVVLWLYRVARAISGGRAVSVGDRTLILHDVVRHTVRRGPRAFLPPHVPLRLTFQALESAGIEYVVLRWSDALADGPDDDDVDLLVRGDDCAALVGILDREPGIRPCDVFASDGRNGHDYRGIPYYQPHLADQILAGATLHPSGCRVPGEREQFLSLAYHAVYHKGLASGLRSRGGPHLSDIPARRLETRYGPELARLAASLGWSLEMTMEGLDELLDEHGWRPSLDTLAKLAPHNAWVAARFFGPHGRAPKWIEAVTVFVVREAAAELGQVERIVDIIADSGFRIIGVVRIDGAARPSCSRMLRGGRWDAGGGPALAIVVRDDKPMRVTPRHRREHPSLDNDRIRRAKQRAREWVQDQAGVDLSVVHSSDSSPEAAEYLRIIARAVGAEELYECAANEAATEEDLRRSLRLVEGRQGGPASPHMHPRRSWAMLGSIAAIHRTRNRTRRHAVALARSVARRLHDALQLWVIGRVR